MLASVDKAVITVVTENFVDMLIPDAPAVKRFNLADHFDPAKKRIRAENGCSYLIDLYHGGRVHTILFDTGLTSETLLWNLEVLGRNPDEIQHIVLSHGHPDHYGGLIGLLKAMSHPVPVAVHPDAFYPRYVRSTNGNVIPFYNWGFRKEEIEADGGRLALCSDSLYVAPGVMTTGYVPAAVSYEPPMAEEGKGSHLFWLKEGRMELDMTPDDMAIAIHVKGQGLMVITGCAHAGVVSSVKQAQKVTGVDRVWGVMGGFHLGFPGVPRDNAHKTIHDLKALGLNFISPNHCSGVHTQAAALELMPEAFVQTTAGMRITIEGK